MSNTYILGVGMIPFTKPGQSPSYADMGAGRAAKRKRGGPFGPPRFAFELGVQFSTRIRNFELVQKCSGLVIWSAPRTLPLASIGRLA